MLVGVDVCVGVAVVVGVDDGVQVGCPAAGVGGSVEVAVGV